MDTTQVGRKKEMHAVLKEMGFYTNATKFKKYNFGVYFTAKCKQGYELLDENDNPRENICKKVTFSPVYRVASLGKLVRAPYRNACIEAEILKDDVDEGEPYCAICPHYVKNVAEKIKQEIIVKTMASKKK